jgi:hypothetical protein
MRGEEADSDLEDDEAVEADPDDRNDPHRNLLGCMSLSKMVVDHVALHDGTKPAEALNALITNNCNSWEASMWSLEQVCVLYSTIDGLRCHQMSCATPFGFHLFSEGLYSTP